MSDSKEDAAAPIAQHILNRTNDFHRNKRKLLQQFYDRWDLSLPLSLLLLSFLTFFLFLNLNGTQ
jgi:hypothetical protein